MTDAQYELEVLYLERNMFITDMLNADTLEDFAHCERQIEICNVEIENRN